MKARLLLTILVAALASCGSDGPIVDGANPDPKCNPLAVGDCFLPFPSSYYEIADSSTATGFRVQIPDGVLPVNQFGKAMALPILNRLDGFSPATSLLANFKVHIDRTKLPPQSDYTQSLNPQSTVQLLKFDTGERVPLFAEVDNNVVDQCTTNKDCAGGAQCISGQCTPTEDQVVLVHPAVRLEPGTRYVVLMRNLVDIAGNVVTVQPFEALKSGKLAPGSPLNAQVQRYRDIFNLAESQGVTMSSLTFAWDFTTASDTLILGDVISMRDQAFKTWESQDLGYTVTAVNEPTDDHLFREIVGTFSVPSFLASDKPDARLGTDASGKPMYRAPQDFGFVVHIPKCALTAQRPLPILMFGHGLFGSAQSEMDSGYEKQLADTLCMVQVGTDWIGLSSSDVGWVASEVVPDLSNFDLVTGRLEQAQVNFLILARLAIRKLIHDPNMAINGAAISDGSEAYWFGCSQGGIEGNTFLTLSPDVDRGVLNVGAGKYSLMLTRSADFAELKHLLDQSYEAQRDQEVALIALQSYWDFADSVSFAPYSLHSHAATALAPSAPLPDPSGASLSPRHILLQEGKNDTQVPNVATRVIVRTMGLPLLDPDNEDVFGVTKMKGPLDAAYTQWDVHGTPPGPYNTPPPADNGVHGAIRKLPQAISQMQQFLVPGGQVVDTCNGQPCSFPSM